MFIIRPYQILVTLFYLLGTLPKVVVQLPIQFTARIFLIKFSFYASSKGVSMATQLKVKKWP